MRLLVSSSAKSSYARAFHRPEAYGVLWTAARTIKLLVVRLLIIAAPSSSYPQLYIVMAALVSLVGASPHHARTMHVHHRRATAPGSYVNGGAAPEDQVLNLKFALTQNDVSTLHQKVVNVSTPGHAEYGQHLSKEEVEELIAPSSDSVQAVNEWLSSHNLTSASFSPAGDVRAVSLTVKQANALLDADYSIFTDQNRTGAKTIRTLSYSIPADLKPHVLTVYPTTQFPSPRKVSQATTLVFKRAEDAQASCSTPFTPPCAQSLYSIPSYIPAQMTSRLGVAAFSDESASYSDLKAFLAKYRPDLPASTNFSTELFEGAVNDQSTPVLKALVSPTVPVTFIDMCDKGGGGFFTNMQEFLSATLNGTNPPQVLSISYAAVEAFSDQATLTSLCNGFSQLAARGISVLVASGDLALWAVKIHPCAAFSTRSSPPHVHIGGTIGQGPEVAWNMTGGGFAEYFPAPSWQTDAIASFSQSIPANYSTGRFNLSNRGYPDVSARMDFVEVLNGSLQTGVGTSLSTPIVASVIALLNVELIAAGKSPLGFLKPFIYANQDAFTDILSGSNPGCKSAGFTATEGWDPITGMGKPGYTKLRAAAGLSKVKRRTPSLRLMRPIHHLCTRLSETPQAQSTLIIIAARHVSFTADKKTALTATMVTTICQPFYFLLLPQAFHIMTIAVDLSLNPQPNPNPHHRNIDFLLNEIKFKGNQPRVTSRSLHNYQFTATSCLSDTDAIKVYRGELVQFPERTVIDVVCKVAYGKCAADILAREAGFYTRRLNDLQGVYVPRFYGHFSERRQAVACHSVQVPYFPIREIVGKGMHTIPEREYRWHRLTFPSNFRLQRDVVNVDQFRIPFPTFLRVGKIRHLYAVCVVLGYGGKAVAMDATRLSVAVDRKFTSALVKAMIAIHDTGLTHGRLDGRHILDNDGRPIIIGFSKARKHDLRCNELHDLFDALGIRKPEYRPASADDIAAHEHVRRLGLYVEPSPKAHNLVRLGEGVQKRVSALFNKAGRRDGLHGYHYQRLEDEH
ncbi:hypothetical protein EVG20_g5800 [Dentipellis fragilis]|uniref:tripeptidyl-peptidase II n=1 Tax=Dentipellis fragilis TaxID=205917 RepID=A0A4Y9YUS5_9AGAM|nr:hypothetical protein EVG20_g5800 [Dentipellis fragilis]